MRISDWSSDVCSSDLDPKSLHVIASNLVELAAIEKSDALKNYRGKRNGINALLKLINEGEDALWKKTGIEKQLHNLLKEQPWLILPEYCRSLTSDQDLRRDSHALANHLGVDEFAALNHPKSQVLLFVMSKPG